MDLVAGTNVPPIHDKLGNPVNMSSLENYYSSKKKVITVPGTMSLTLKMIAVENLVRSCYVTCYFTFHARSHVTLTFIVERGHICNMICYIT